MPLAAATMAALIGAGSSLAGGMIGAGAKRRADKFNADRQDNQLQRMVKDAAAAGIHPVAAIGAGANYGSATASSYSPMGDAVAEGGRQVSGLIMQNQELQNQSLSLDIERKRLELDAEAMALADAQSRSMIQAMRQGGTDRAAPSTSPDGRTYTTALGTQMRLDESLTDQQQWEDRYGGIVGEAMGLGNFIRDTIRNMFSSPSTAPLEITVGNRPGDAARIGTNL